MIWEQLCKRAKAFSNIDNTCICFPDEIQVFGLHFFKDGHIEKHDNLADEYSSVIIAEDRSYEQMFMIMKALQ